MRLETYRRKRDFQRTPEPRGERDVTPAAPGPLRFVVQEHAARRLHWDFRLELDGALLSWAVPKGPSLDPAERRLAVRTEDHPLEYAAFEGVIPAGEYGGGSVIVWDRGAWEPEGDPRRGLRRGSLTFRLEGEKLEGGWRLVRTGREAGEKESWLLIKRRDAHAVEGGAPIVEQEPRSVISGRRVDEVARRPETVWRSHRGGRRRGPESPAGEPAEGAGPELGDPAAIPGAKEGPLPTRPRPQLATLAEAPPEGDDWLHEVKHDGYRLLVRVEHGKVELLTRRGQDWPHRFPAIAEAAARLPCRAALLDGEAVVLDRRGVSDFQRLQQALSGQGDPRAARLVAFDLLHLDGWDLTDAPLRARKEALRHLLAALPAGARGLRFGDHLVGDGGEVLARACAAGLEGVVSKRADSRYYMGLRCRAWLKVKCFLRQELVVLGWSRPEGSRVGIGALILGLPEGGGWVEAGRVGTGFDDAALREWRRRLAPLERDRPTVTNPTRGAEGRRIRWVEPRDVVEVAFAGWTRDGRVRQASYLGLREDARAEEVRRELVEPVRGTGPRRPAPRGNPGRGGVEVGPVRVTNPERVLFGEVGATKLELVRYYERVAPLLLPYAAGRPLTLVRCPAGLDGEEEKPRQTRRKGQSQARRCFYQKHARASIPAAVTRVPIEEAGGTALYLAVEDEVALLSLAQHGVIELHLWGSRIDRLDRPDRLVLDLDPGPGVGWDALVLAARVVRRRLQELGLETFPLSTGGNGLHLVAPLVRRHGWARVKGFAQALARELARAHPRAFTARMAKKEREGRIYLDYLRNDEGSTAVCPWSVRARPGAPVAAPLTWEELDPAAPLRFGVRDVDALVARGDPWTGYFERRQSIGKAALEALG